MSTLSIPVKTISPASRLFATEVNQIVDAINSKQDALTIVNNLTTTATGNILDARQAKVLKDLIDQLTTTLNGKEPSIIAGTSTQYYRGDKVFATLNQDAVPSGTTNKVFTSTEKDKLAALSNYTLPVATASVLGGVKQGTNITIANDGTISSTASGSGGSATTDASLLTSGTLDVARLPAIPISQVTSLQSSLDGKSNVGHSQAATTITGLATVATTGVYSDLTGKPTLFSGSYTDLTNKPVFISVFTNDAGYQTAANLTTALATKEPTITTGTTSQYIRGDKTLATLNADVVPDGTTNKAFLASERVKLTGITVGASANDTDANLKARANHTGTQTASTISDFTTAVQALIVSPAPVVETYTTGTTIALANATTRLIINPASTVATLTVTLPATPTNGQNVRIYIGGTVTSGTVITSLTVSASQGIVQAPAFTATDGQYGDTYSYEYLSSTSKWYLI